MVVKRQRFLAGQLPVQWKQQTVARAEIQDGAQDKASYILFWLGNKLLNVH